MRAIPIRALSRRTVATALGLGTAALLTAGCGTMAGTPSAMPSAAAAPTTAPTKAKAKGITGQITAENADSWTVLTAEGKTYTVTLTPQTQFGTEKKPSTQQAFPVGTTVRVTGTPDGTTVSAVRIAAPARAATPSATPSAAVPG